MGAEVVKADRGGGGGGKQVAEIEISCPWMDNRSTEDREKTAKHDPLSWEVKQQFSGYNVKQFNIAIDVFGRWSVQLGNTMKELVRQLRSRSVLRRIQKVNLSHSLNLACAFKILMLF